MKTFIKLTCILALLVVSNQLSAQDAEKPAKPRFFAFNQNKVANVNLAEINALQDSVFAPILNELVDEGKLIGWGQLMHLWGDEWNYNFYFVTENHRAFLDFWSEYLKRVNQRLPDWQEKALPLMAEHKDNFYFIRAMR